MAYLNLRQAKALVRAGLDQPVLGKQRQEEAEENHLEGWPEKEVCVFMHEIDTREVRVALDQGMPPLILKGEGSLTGLTSCPYRIYLLGISCISACKVSFQHQNSLVQTSKDRRTAYVILPPSVLR